MISILEIHLAAPLLELAVHTWAKMKIIQCHWKTQECIVQLSTAWKGFKNIRSWYDFICNFLQKIRKLQIEGITKALEISYTLIDHYKVDKHWLSEAFVGARTRNFDVKPTDGITILAYFGKGGKFWKD